MSQRWPYDSHISSSPSSSPPCSSSPPTSPLMSTYSHPRIASRSPSQTSEFDHRPIPSSWLQATKTTQGIKLPSFRSMFGDLAPCTSSDIEFVARLDHWESTAGALGKHTPVFYSDSDEEHELEDDGPGSQIENADLGSRATFFQTSDERAKWKEPLPPFISAFRQRQSEPATSRPIPIFTNRNASEPAHAGLDFVRRSRGNSYDADLESENPTSDGGLLSSPDMRPFSLPPSSPPLSTTSLPVSPDLAPMSCMFSPLPSLSPSIPSLILGPSSPAIIPLPSDDIHVDNIQLASSDPPAVSEITELAEPLSTCDAGVYQGPVPNSGATVEVVEPLTVKVDGGDLNMADSQSSVLTIQENDAKRRKSEEPLPRKKARIAGPSKSKPRKSKDTDENSAIVPKQRKKKAITTPRPLPLQPTRRRRRRQPSFSSSSSSNESESENGEPPQPVQKLDMSPEDLEICGMIIETMATSRASTLSASTLYRSLMANRPSLKRDWSTDVFMRVLEKAHGQNGIFGKVESSGMDDSDRPLEAQWFYVPERDEDQDRAALIRSMMPRPAKRSETKKYKQYYYRPLGKISRWDDEDAL